MMMEPLTEQNTLWIVFHFYNVFNKGRQLCDYVCFPPVHQGPSENGFTLKGKNLQGGANYFLFSGPLFKRHAQFLTQLSPMQVYSLLVNIAVLSIK